MLRRWTRGDAPAVFITDTGMLMGDVLVSSRGPKITSLLWALHYDGVVLILPRHVVVETLARLGKRARPGDDVELARQRFLMLYLPRALVVDEVPEEWGAGDPRVEALARRDLTDLPTARLAVALAPCHLLAEDNDICTPGLGVSNWLPLAHAAANDAELSLAVFATGVPTVLALESAKAASRALSRASAPAQLVAAALLVVGIMWWSSSGRARRAWERVGPLVAPAGRAVGPPLVEILQRGLDVESTLAQQLVMPAPERTLAEVVACVLATDATPESPMLASDVARRIEGCGNLVERTKMVRDILRNHPNTFTQISRGRFALGRRMMTKRPDLAPAEVAEFLCRSHRAAGQLLDSPPVVTPAQSASGHA